MTAPLFTKVRAIVADVLRVPESRITPGSSPENVETWDSPRHLSLVLAFEQEFGMELDPEEIDQMDRVERIVEVLEHKLNHHT